MAKAKKKSLSEVSQQKRNQQNKKSLNPFEVHINRDKQNVLGKRGKADRGLPGISRAKAINKRKGTILQEYKLKNKDNLFLDKRIGERNVMMNEEDKAIARFAAERIKAHKKKSIYNLNDEEVLTHKGQTLEEIEKFDDPKSDDEFSEDEYRSGKLDNKFVEEAHFGGGLLSKPDSQKSRKDIIDELIAESKKRKAEKQKIREQTIGLTEKLDSEWKDLLPIVTISNKNIPESNQKPKADDYDIAVRELKFEAKGTPSDKLKSEKEIVEEEKEKLEALERDRLARMKGLINDSSNEIKHKSADDLDDGFLLETVDDETVDEEVNSNENREKKSNKNSSDISDFEDDEDDNDNDDDEDNDNGGSDNDDLISNNDEDQIGKLDDETHDPVANKEESNNSAESELDENSNADESESSEEDNLSDLKESESSSEDENELGEEVAKVTTKEKLLSNKSREQEIRDDLLKRKEIMENARKELPYTYKIPENFEELRKLLQNHNADYQSLIIERIIKCNHWSLDKNNKEKLSNLFSFLLQHINDSAVENNVENVIKCFQILDRLSPFLYDLAHLNPQNAKTSVQTIIKEKHEAFEKNKKRYPSLDTIIFFKLISLLFPTSDFRHPVTTPCLIFMSQILFRCRVKNKLDISKGLFICTLILEYTVLSKRFAPSVINFLRGIIYVSTPKHLIQGIKMIPPFKTVGDLSNLLILDEDQTDLDIDLNATLMKASDLVYGTLDNAFKIRALSTAIKLLHEFKNHLEELEAVYSIFEPIVKLLKPNTFDKYPKTLRNYARELCKQLESLKDKKLEYLVREKKKPKPLKLYEPQIEAVYDGKKRRTVSKDKAEKEKLLHKYKKEMKGAMREIRRDRTFLAKIKIKEQIRNDEERKRKVKEIFGEAAVQQGELKKMKRKK